MAANDRNDTFFLVLFFSQKKCRIGTSFGLFGINTSPPKFCLNEGEVDASVGGNNFNYTVRGS